MLWMIPPSAVPVDAIESMTARFFMKYEATTDRDGVNMSAKPTYRKLIQWSAWFPVPGEQRPQELAPPQSPQDRKKCQYWVLIDSMKIPEIQRMLPAAN